MMKTIGKVIIELIAWTLIFMTGLTVVISIMSFVLWQNLLFNPETLFIYRILGIMGFIWGGIKSWTLIKNNII